MFCVTDRQFSKVLTNVILTLRYRIVAQCALIVFGSKIQPGHAYLIPCVYCFWAFFSIFFGLFHQYFPNFSLFYANFIHFPHLVPLVNFGYTGKNYTVCLFHPVCLLKIWYFSTLCVYSIPCVY